jgi:hypothetical protein
VLARFAAGREHTELARLVHAIGERLDQDGPEPDPTAQRALSLAKHPDGGLGGRFHLDPVGGQRLQTALESSVQARRPAGDPRSRAQRQADALRQLCDIHLGCGSLPLPRGVTPHIARRIDLADLRDPATGPGAAEAGFTATLSAARARRVAGDADPTRLARDPDGHPLDVGRAVRLVTPAIRKTVEARDRHCVFTGCSAPTWWREVHHVIAWACGGPTSLANSGLLCERHHTQAHHGFRIERDATGHWHTYRPDGIEIHVLAQRHDDPELARAG